MNGRAQVPPTRAPLTARGDSFLRVARAQSRRGGATSKFSRKQKNKMHREEALFDALEGQQTTPPEEGPPPAGPALLEASMSKAAIRKARRKRKTAGQIGVNYKQESRQQAPQEPPA